MKDEIDHLRELDARAHAGPPPQIDVTGRVMRTIAAREAAERRESFRVALFSPASLVAWEWGAAAATVCAFVTAALAWQAMSECLDPLHGLFGAFLIGTP